jgi:hypothetical protein
VPARPGEHKLRDQLRGSRGPGVRSRGPPLQVPAGQGPSHRRRAPPAVRPPWWPETSTTFTIACIGDSLTESISCGKCAESVFNPANQKQECSKYEDAALSYPKLLERYLGDVGIQASVTNYGISGAFVWRGSPSAISTYPAAALNYHYGLTQQQTTGPYDNAHWYGKSQGDLDLAIIWLGTNDAVYVSNAGPEMGWEQLKTQLMEDFTTVMQHRKARHYLLIKIDGTRYKNNVNNVDCRDNEGAIDLAACPLSGGAPSVEAAVRLVNDAILALEQKYHNVHVAEIDYSKERCIGGETAENIQGPFYLHFGKNEGVAKSIFDRIMCHAVFHRPTGDLRWVGAVPNAKRGDVVLPTLTTLAAAR